MNTFRASSSQPLMSVSAACPLNQGLAVVDQLLAAVGQAGDANGLDAALDLRLALAGDAAPADLLQAFFRVRALVEEQHYLACYRLRRWLEARYLARVRPDRTQARTCVPLSLAQVDNLTALATDCALAAGTPATRAVWCQVEFVSASCTSE